MRLDIIKDYITKFSGSTKDELLQSLQRDPSLDRDEKNAIYLWLFPFLLRDRELPEKIKEVRVDEVLLPSDAEIVTLIGAYKSAQYGNFIRHLLHAFTDPSKVFPYNGELTEKDCSICGKELIPSGQTEDRVRMAYGSEESSVHLCLKCLLNLQALHMALMILEGDDYLNRYKR